MELSFWTYVFVCAMVFLAGFIDSIAGGGGLISLPAYYAAGLPPWLAAGTNKMGAFWGTAVATGNYARKQYIPWKLGLAALAGSLPGSWMGAHLFTVIPEQTVRIAVLIALPIIAVFVLMNKDALTPKQRVPEKYMIITCFCIGLVVGIYDGLVGPGTGTFLQLLFVSLIGMEALNAAGAARLVNLGSNVGALVSLISQGKVLYSLALPAAAFGILGNYLGSNLAIKKGSKIIRALLIVVLGLLIAKMAYDVFM